MQAKPKRKWSSIFFHGVSLLPTRVICKRVGSRPIRCRAVLPICQWKTVNLLRLFPPVDDHRCNANHIFMSLGFEGPGISLSLL
jgi:hypothetical protein